MIRVLLDMLVGDERSIRPEASDMDQEYVLYYTASAILRGIACNAGIDEALERIKDLRRQGVKVRVEDTSQMSENELQTAYIRVTTPSVMKKYPIRQVFGSRRHAGFMFGRGVPALVVYSQSREMAEDVFPHEESGRIMTINEFLSRLHTVRLTQAKRILRDDPLVQNLRLDGEPTWTDTHSAMRAVADACGKPSAAVAFSTGTRGRGLR